MKKRKIPSNMQPWTANINGKEYEYESGTTAEVPDEVAALIDFIDESAPKRDPKAAQRAIEDEVTQIVKDEFAGGVGYEETAETVMLPETSFEVVVRTPVLISNLFPYTFEVGRDYTVTWDGETNTYTAIENNGGGGVLTNTSLNDSGAGNGWLISASEGMCVLVTRDQSLVGTHTINISGSVHEVHKIDRKFMPAMGKEDKPLYDETGVLFADYNGSALEPNELAELLKTKHCYITKPTVQEARMEILSYSVFRTNNVVDAVKCYFIDSSTGTISSTQNGEIQGS